MVPDVGHRACEASVAGKAKDFADQNEVTAKLLEVVQEFRIDVPISKGKLVTQNKRAVPKKRPASKTSRKKRK